MSLAGLAVRYLNSTLMPSHTSQRGIRWPCRSQHSQPSREYLPPSPAKQIDLAQGGDRALVEQLNLTLMDPIDEFCQSLRSSAVYRPLRCGAAGDTYMALTETGGLAGSHLRAGAIGRQLQPVRAAPAWKASRKNQLVRRDWRRSELARDDRDNINSHRPLLHPTTRDNRL
jgi:hypothetical protein